jgi:hypothetical protein
MREMKGYVRADLKSGIPQETEMPAPEMTTIFEQD